MQTAPVQSTLLVSPSAPSTLFSAPGSRQAEAGASWQPGPSMSRARDIAAKDTESKAASLRNPPVAFGFQGLVQTTHPQRAEGLRGGGEKGRRDFCGGSRVSGYFGWNREPRGRRWRREQREQHPQHPPGRALRHHLVGESGCRQLAGSSVERERNPPQKSEVRWKHVLLAATAPVSPHPLQNQNTVGKLPSSTWLHPDPPQVQR